MKYCFISNIGPHYRWPIYNLMSKTFDMDFYFGEKLSNKEEIKIFDYKNLRGFQHCLENKKIYGPLWYQKGVLPLIFKKYEAYIMLGAPFCVSSWIFLLLAKVFGKKTIAWTHGVLHKHNGVKKWVLNKYFGMFNIIMTYNERSMRLLREDGLYNKKMVVIGNSLDSDTHKSIREQLQYTNEFSNHFENNNPVVLYCGRIQKVKRLDLVLDALCVLREKGIKCNFVIVGSDTSGSNIAGLIAERKMQDSVWMYGACYDEKELGQLFFNSHVCVSPGNVGLTAIHSLSFGCPVITNGNFDSQMPEFEAIIPTITGDFFEENNYHDLASKIEIWISKSPAQRAQTRICAFSEIDRKWNIHVQIDILKNVLNN